MDAILSVSFGVCIFLCLLTLVGQVYAYLKKSATDEQKRRSLRVFLWMLAVLVFLVMVRLTVI
jgi:hypothetical protein